MADIFQEIEDDLKHEQYQRLWKRYGNWLIVIAVLIVLGTAAFVFIREHRQTQRVEASAAYNDAQITEPFCRIANADFNCALPGPAGEANALLAPDGTRLPVTAKLKGNLLGRFEFGLGSLDAHFQAGVIYEGRRTTDLRLAERAIIGDLDPYAGVDLSFGVAAASWTAELFVTNLFDERGQIDRNVQCVETVCGDPDGVTASGGKFYTQITQPRLIGLKVGTKF